MINGLKLWVLVLDVIALSLFLINSIGSKLGFCFEPVEWMPDECLGLFPASEHLYTLHMLCA